MEVKELFELCSSRKWRMRNLYSIVGKGGNRLVFTPNWAQSQLEADLWYCNIILKARQLGISTYICLLFLDACLFNSNMSAGIICQTEKDSLQMFKRIKYAYENLPIPIRSMRKVTTDTAHELVFSNGSSIKVGTLMRGYTLQYLHISEFGKICAKFPEKAEEIISGSLNTVASGQFVFIESTAEGKEGRFFEMCKVAENQQKLDTELSKLDYRFHFFPWWQEPSYREGSQTIITQENLDYFKSLDARGIHLDHEQKYWYSRRHSIQGDKMFREFPSTPEEAWQSSIDGSYYSTQMSLVHSEKRIGFIPYDITVPVHTSWDLGYNDSTAIWFFQVIGKEIHLIEYIEGSGESLHHWLAIVNGKKYSYGKHLAPHDITSHEYTTGMTRQVSARKMGVNFTPVPKVEVVPGIDAVRSLLSRCFFDESKCSVGIKCLENYKKRWNERSDNWATEPLHNKYSHGADAMRYLAVGLSRIVNLNEVGDPSFGLSLGHNLVDSGQFQGHSPRFPTQMR